MINSYFTRTYLVKENLPPVEFMHPDQDVLLDRIGHGIYSNLKTIHQGCGPGRTK